MKELYLTQEQVRLLLEHRELVASDLLKVTIVNEDQAWPTQDRRNSYGLQEGGHQLSMSLLRE